MNLNDIVHRTSQPIPWDEGERIPWDEPGFSARMLREHLSQAHDAASRRAEIIDQQVAWIHQHVLGGRLARILDLGCGPGLYASRLAALGHDCTGIDFSPASIAYANAHKTGDNPAYIHADIRQAAYGSDRDLVMLIFGEFNVFKPADAHLILTRANAALKPGGTLLMEPHTFEIVREMGQQPATWSSAESGLFCEQPHLLLHECLWQAEVQATVRRWFILDAATGAVTRHADSMQAYTEAQYRELLHECGFDTVEFYPALGDEAVAHVGLVAVTARKSGSDSDAGNHHP